MLKQHRVFCLYNQVREGKNPLYTFSLVLEHYAKLEGPEAGSIEAVYTFR